MTAESIGKAISEQLATSRKLAKQQAIRKYASVAAGTIFDLDPVLESAATEELLAAERTAS